jgi:hypothetical protein
MLGAGNFFKPISAGYASELVGVAKTHIGSQSVEKLRPFADVSGKLSERELYSTLE